MTGDGRPLAGLAFSGAPMPIAVVPLEGEGAGCFAEVNDALCSFVGYSRDELLGRPVSDFTYREDWTEASRMADVLAGSDGAVHDVAVRYVRRTGRAVWARVFVRALRTDAGRRVAVSHIVDIDEELRSYEKLLASEQRYRMMVHLAQEGIWAIDAEATTTFVNDRMAAMLHYKRHDMVGRSLYEFLAPHYRQQGMEAFERRRAGQFERRIVQLARRDGTNIWASISTGPLRDDKDKFAGAIALVIDITEQRAARLALEASERRFRALVENSWDIITVLGPDGSMEYVSPAATRLLGWRDSHLSRPPLAIHPDDLASFAGAFREVVDGVRGPDKPIVYRVFNDTGELRVIESVVQNLLHDPAVERLVMNSRDVTDRVRAMEALQQQERRVAELSAAAQQQELELELQRARRLETVGRLAGGVAHDFNNLLGVIRRCAEALAARAEAGAPTDERDVAAIHDAAERGSLLVRRLLRLGGRGSDADVVDLDAVLDDLLSLARRALGPVDVVRTRADVPCRVRVHADELEQLVLNLLLNARDASADGATIELASARVRGTDDRDVVELRVADHGAGMTDEVRALAVEPFFTTNPGAGSGLGLATVLATVERAGGSLEIDSTPGVGTTVVVRLPDAAAPATPPVPTVAAPSLSASTRTGALLVVDDDLDVLRATVQMLRAAGRQVVGTASADDALRWVGEGFRPAVVVSDVRMPAMTGIELARRLREEHDIPTVLVTGWAGDVAVGDAEVLVKPLTRDALLRAIDVAGNGSGNGSGVPR